MDKDLCIVMLPTYNEAGNIGLVVEKVLSVADNMRVLVVDDDSGDRTWEIAEGIAARDKRVTVIRRSGDRGRGLAGREGYMYALGTGAGYIIEMDADLSHDPAYIPSMLEAIKGCDVVIGSRFLAGGGDERKSVARYLISRLAGMFIRKMLGIEMTDPTSGYRCFTREALREIDPASLEAETPFIVLETLYRISRLKMRTREIPIVFRPRGQDASKLSVVALLSCLAGVIRLKVRGK